MEFGVQALEFRVWGAGFRNLESRVWELGIWVESAVSLPKMCSFKV